MLEYSREARPGLPTIRTPHASDVATRSTPLARKDFVTYQGIPFPVNALVNGFPKRDKYSTAKAAYATEGYPEASDSKRI